MTARPTTAEALAALRATVEGYMKAVERDRVEAKEQRDLMSKDIAAIRSNASKIDNRVATMEKDMASVKPVIAAWMSGQAKITGAIVVLGAIGSAVIGVVLYFKQQITQTIWGG